METRGEMEDQKKMGRGGGREGFEQRYGNTEKTLEEKQEEKKGKMCSDCLLYSARYVLHYYIFRLGPCLL